MANLPEEAEIRSTTTVETTRSLELSVYQVKQILIDWAKSRGFSHQAEVKFHSTSYDEDDFAGALITETTTKTSKD